MPTGQLVKCLPREPWVLRLIPSTHITKPDRTVYDCNSSSGEVDTGGSCGSMAGQPGGISELQVQ